MPRRSDAGQSIARQAPWSSARRGASAWPVFAAGPRLLGQRRGNEAARSDPAIDVALRHQLFESSDHGDPRDLEVMGQRAGRRQALARTQAAIENRIPVAVIELPMQRFGEAAIERDDRTESVGRAFHATIIMVLSKLA
jgi:hypothetical protein